MKNSSFSLKNPSVLRLGILGAAHIAHGFCAAAAHSPLFKVTAVGSRNLSAAQDFASTHKIANAYGSYEAVLNDAEIDAVYIPLPNSLHHEWAIRAAKAGKHVLCEKPLALNETQAREMFAAAQKHGVRLLEAFPWMFQPQTAQMMSLINRGAIGRVRSVQSAFGFYLTRAEGNIRMNRELGGGALMDVGCYALSLIRLVMGDVPESISTQARFVDEHQTDDGQGVDMQMIGQMHWVDGRRAQFSCGMDSAQHRLASIVGTEGVIETEYLNHHGAPLPSHMRIRRGSGATQFEALEAPFYPHEGNGFRCAAESLVKLIALGKSAQAEQMQSEAAKFSIDLARMIEAAEHSARSGKSVTLA